MIAFWLFLIVVVIAAAYLGRMRLRQQLPKDKDGKLARPQSLPRYFMAYAALWAGVPTLVFLLVSYFSKAKLATIFIVNRLGADLIGLNSGEVGLLINQMESHISGLIISSDPLVLQAADHYHILQSQINWAILIGLSCLFVGGLAYALLKIKPQFRAREAVERYLMALMFIASLVAILTTLGIVLSLIFESWRFFTKVPVWEFLFGLEWSPQIALREDQVASEGSFGAVPLFAGTLLITLIAMLVAGPIGLFSAIFLSEYAKPNRRAIIKPSLEILAGVPTVVYGVFAALSVAPLIKQMGAFVGLDVASESALAAGLVMGVMIIPFVSSLSDDVIAAVPNSLREAALGLGATRAEMIKQVVLPAALPGIVGALLLAVSRAIGETMIVVMAAGLSANLTANPLESVTTVTVQIVTLLVGDQEFDSAKTLAAFALGFALFLITLLLNIIALGVVRRFREQYD